MPINTGTVLLPRRQEQVVEGIITRKTRALAFNGIVLPQDNTLDIATKKLTREFVDSRGEAVVIADDNDDIPLVQVAVTEESENTVLIATSYRTTIDEYDAFSLASRNGQQATDIIQYRVTATNQVLEEKKHQLGAFGMPTMGITGMLNANFELEIDATDPLSLTSATDLLAWVNGHYKRRRIATKLIEKPNYILMTEALDTHLTTTFFDQGFKSVMDVFLESNRRKGLMGVMPLNELVSEELEANGVHTAGTNRDRMMIYGLNKDNICRKISRKRQYPPEYRRRGFDNPIAQRVSSVFVNYEGSAEYVDYPKSA